MRRPWTQQRRLIGGKGGLLPPGPAAAAPPAPPADTPLTVYGADLHQWLRGDLGITIVTGVSSWADQSGKGNDAIQGTGSAQPAYTASDATLDNQPTLTADGANDVLTSAALTMDVSTEDVYFCAIVKQNGWVSADALSHGAGTNIPRLAQFGASPAVLQLGSLGGVNSNNAGTIGSWFRFEWFHSATAGTSYIKIGSTVVSGANPGTGTRTSSTLLGAPASNFIAAAIAEFFIVKRAAGSGGPTGAERARNDAYLQTRYPSASF